MFGKKRKENESKKNNKVVLVGINHAGTSFLKNFRSLNKDAELVAYDRNDNISFLGCGIALWVDGTVKDPNGLFYATPQQLVDMNISVNMKHEVININRDLKKITVKNLETNETFEDSYDKLVYAAGSWPIMPPFEGKDLKGVEICKIYQHANIIKAHADNPEIKNVVVVGAGYIGIELAEAFNKKGKNTTIIDVVDRPVPKYFDSEFTDPLVESMKKHKLNMAFGEKVVKIEGKDGNVTHVVTDKNTYEADLVIVSVGFRPNTNMLEGINKMPNGSIIVDAHMKSSDDDIYAIGDCMAAKFAPTGDYTSIPLATNAVKSGLVAAHALGGKGNLKLNSLVGTNAINVFDQQLTSTGVTEETSKVLGLDVLTSTWEDNDRPEFLNDEGTRRVKCKMVFDRNTRRLLGAQIASYGTENHSEAIFFLALAIEKQMTIEEVAIVDVYFLPHFNKPLNYLLMTALNAPKE